MLKISTIETAREMNVVLSILKLFKRRNKTWLKTLEETILIQQEGRQKRRKVEYELTQWNKNHEKLTRFKPKEKRVKEEMMTEIFTFYSWRFLYF